jgi:osmotically-inducible protein OsmY
MQTFDEALRESVVRELAEDPSVDATGIGIAASDGAITLSGHVSSDAQRRAAVRAVERVYGVLAIADEIEVDVALSDGDDDSKLAEEIASERRWSALIPTTVEAEVSNGHVTLRGEVEWGYQQTDTVRVISELVGSERVTNLIERKAREAVVEPKPKAIERQVESAIDRVTGLD